MTLVELSKKSGVQVATLSRMENGKMVGTLESHMNIAKVLGMDITTLYQQSLKPAEPPIVEPSGPGTEEFKHSEDSGYEILTKKILNKKMMPILIRIEAGAQTPVEQGARESEKFIYALEGTIELTVHEQKFLLEKGHTLYFDASLPHRLRNVSKHQARALCVSTPVML
ncbi:MAG: helix-turn-helix transcriptional regulator [Candidatus Omnitrophica bacterium]|nr:helix-turn-helix transcriptional regulator [Candidatus Omnitrophota bacterium]